MTASQRCIRIVVSMVLVAAAAAALLNAEWLDAKTLELTLDGLGAWAPIAFIVAFAIGTVALVPGTLFGLAGGAFFGPLWGTILNLIGGTLGAAVAFVAARYVLGDWVKKRAGGKLHAIMGGVEAEGWRFVALTRLVPAVPFNLLNYGLGLTTIPLRHYVLATLICMAPGTAAYAWLGHAAKQAAGGNSDALQFALMGLGLLALIVFLPRVMRRMKDTSRGWISVDELKRRLASGAPVIVIDVRGPEEFVGPFGHIPGARNIPLPDLSHRMREIAVPADGAAVLVCRTDKRSAKAADVLRAASMQKVYVLRGGMEKWSVERPS